MAFHAALSQCGLPLLGRRTREVVAPLQDGAVSVDGQVIDTRFNYGTCPEYALMLHFVVPRINSFYSFNAWQCRLPRVAPPGVSFNVEHGLAHD